MRQVIFGVCCAWIVLHAQGAEIVSPAKSLPLMADVDVLVVGGSAGAVAAACRAKAEGARVYVVSPRPYLGEDLAGKLRLRPEAGDEMRHPLMEKLFSSHAKEKAGAEQTKPIHIKKTLDNALLQAQIPFFTGALASDPLVDDEGNLAGAVIVNRSGRQAIRAKVVIDATERGHLARLAGAQATPFPAGTYTFTRQIIAGEAPKADGMRVQELLGIDRVKVTGVKQPKGMVGIVTGRLFSCSIDLPMKDGSMRSFSEAEQQARDLTFVPTQLDAADTLSLVPPDWFKGRATVRNAWQGSDALNLDVCRPQGTEYLFVLGPLADLSREAAEHVMLPGSAMLLGERIGEAAAQIAAKRPTLKGVRLAGQGHAISSEKITEHDGEITGYLRTATGTVPAEARDLPVLASCDVVVAGAGTGGAPAGIAAARQGAKVIVCEYLHQMGGVQTDGLIGCYCFGLRVGFTRELDEAVAKIGPVYAQCKAEWYRRENRRAGAEIWFGTLVCGVVVENNRVTGVVVTTPHGERGVIRCRTAIDATGNADLAAMAGEQTEFISAEEIAIQGAGQTPKQLGASYLNTDVAFVDDTDAADLCFFALRARSSFGKLAWDQAQVVNSRERRRLVGAFYVTPQDVMNIRTYPDVIAQTLSNFDTHGQTIDTQFFIEDPGHKPTQVNLPYRCLLPKRLEGLLVIGLGMSAHRDAMPILRMQPDVQNQGYAAGVAAAMANKANVVVRDVNIKALQKHLVEKGILPHHVLSMTDSYPISDKELAGAVDTLTNAYAGLSIVLVDPERSFPLLRQAREQMRTPETRLIYSHVLNIMGCATGEEDLIEKIRSQSWDKGWNYRGMGQFGRSVSWMDSYIIALGRAKSLKALPILLEKASELSVTNEYSHFRAVAMALESINDPSGAPALAALLAKPGISGHAMTMQVPVPKISGYDRNSSHLGVGDQERSECLRELSLARALFHLGDVEGRGTSILRAYVNDPRGAYAKHARMVLAKKAKGSQ